MDEAQDILTSAILSEGEREQIRIERWRIEELERAGYEQHQARRLANKPHVDLHAAIDLLVRGCPRDTAMRILL